MPGMITPSLAAQIFVSLSLLVSLFQAALAAGLPWGAASMGGKYPGKYPTKMRWAALANIVFLLFMAAIVLSRAGMYFPTLASFAHHAIWGVVVFSGLGTILNTITPSKIERIWAPVALLQLATAWVAALS